MAHVENHLNIEELRSGWRSSGDVAEARHYQTIWHLAQGRTIPETAGLTGFVPRWIEELLARYNAFGPLALGDLRRGNGAKPKLLTPEILARLRVRLESDPDGGGVWDLEEGGGIHRRRAGAG